MTCEPNAITRCNADRDGATQHTGGKPRPGRSAAARAAGRPGSAGPSPSASAADERVRGQDGEGPVGSSTRPFESSHRGSPGAAAGVEDHEEGGQREEHEGPPPNRVVAAEWHGERAEQEQNSP